MKLEHNPRFTPKQVLCPANTTEYTPPPGLPRSAFAPLAMTGWRIGLPRLQHISFVIARVEVPKQSRRAEILRFAQDDRERAQDPHSRIQAGKFGYQELES